MFEKVFSLCKETGVAYLELTLSLIHIQMCIRDRKKDEEAKDSLGILIPPISIDKPKDVEIPPIAETQENNEVKDEDVDVYKRQDYYF